MKSRFTFIFTFILLSTTISCKKSIGNYGIVGNWKLIEVYDGYVNGGSFQWNVVPSEHQHILSFTSDGRYEKKENQNNCVGTYTIINIHNLEIRSNCNIGTEKALISELTHKFLILDYQGREGKIRDKYVATK